MADIKLITDTSADMPQDLIEKYDIGIMRFLSIFGEDSYVSGKDITNEEFYEKMVTEDIIPTTSQTPYADMYDMLLSESKKHDTVIYFTISSKGSGQNHTANMIVDEIKEEYPEADIRIVDSMSYSVYISSAVAHIAKMKDKGLSADELIKEFFDYMKTWEVYLVVGDLKYLQKGGRITKTTAIVGNLLDIKPVLTIRDGLIEPLEKIRGSKKLCKKIIALMKDNSDFDESKNEFIIVDSDKALGEAMIDALKEEFGDITVTMRSEFGPIVGTHTGPGCLAILFKLKGE